MPASGHDLVPHRRNLQLKAPTHVVGVVRCPPSVEVSLRTWPAELTTNMNRSVQDCAQPATTTLPGA